jgi:hypothetical protein
MTLTPHGIEFGRYRAWVDFYDLFPISTYTALWVGFILKCNKHKSIVQIRAKRLVTWEISMEIFRVVFHGGPEGPVKYR